MLWIDGCLLDIEIDNRFEFEFECFCCPFGNTIWEFLKDVLPVTYGVNTVFWLTDGLGLLV